MAKLYMVCVRDRALGAFLRPFSVPALGAALRSFQDEVNRADGEICKHPDDYDLYHLGEFDDITGALTAVSPPVQIAIGKQLVKGD